MKKESLKEWQRKEYLKTLETINRFHGIGYLGHEIIQMDSYELEEFDKDMQAMDNGTADLTELGYAYRVPIIILKYFQKLEILNPTLYEVIFG